MLINPPISPLRDDLLEVLAKMEGNDQTPKKLQDGVYQIGHYGSSNFLDGWAYDQFKYFRHKDRDKIWAKYQLSINSYGVCDSPDQILAQCPELFAPDRGFVITVTPVIRKNQNPQGGWRWHKWGPYIGTHKIQHEYLYDEEGIEQVLVFHIYEKDRAVKE
jgi:hypothetical protein